MRQAFEAVRGRHGPVDPAAGPLRQIGLRLAALLVGLLCALLLLLVAVVYYRTGADSLSAAQSTLRDRAHVEVHHYYDAPGGRPRTIHELPQEGQERGESFIVFADQHLHVIGEAGNPFGNRLPDPGAAGRAITTHHDRLSGVDTGSDIRYGIYTLPVEYQGSVVGVIQTGTSLRSYEQSLHALLISLLLVGALGLLASAGITGLVVYRALIPIRDALAHQRDFVADAAHELRAPLAILRTAAELWLDPEDEEDQQAAVEQVLAQSSHLAHLVDDLSLLARADSGAVRVAREPLDLGGLVADIVGGMELVAEERGVVLDLQIEPTAVWGDAPRLRQLLLILLDNALKHSTTGGRISVEVTHPGGHALLQVRDWGPGIDPADLPHLFDRFYRADRARSGDGTGLGLAIGRWIVKAQGGTIRAINAPGGGALLSVSLPLATWPPASGSR